MRVRDELLAPIFCARRAPAAQHPKVALSQLEAVAVAMIRLNGSRAVALLAASSAPTTSPEITQLPTSSIRHSQTSPSPSRS